MSPELVVHVAGELMAKKFVDGAAVGAELLHGLDPSPFAETRRVAMERQLQGDEALITRCEDLSCGQWIEGIFMGIRAKNLNSDEDSSQPPTPLSVTTEPRP